MSDVSNRVQQDGDVPEGVSEISVRQQLQRILSNMTFTRSDRRRDFLTYVVEKTLAGNPDALRGDEIAVAVFQRGDEFDPQADPVVRIEARRLRKALGAYYAGEGKNDPVRIDIPKGGYRAMFSWREVTSQSGPTEAPHSEPEAPAGPARQGRWYLMATMVALLVLGFVGYVFWPKPEVTERLGPPGLAIAMFEARSAIPEDEFFARGLADQVVNDLQPFGTVRVFALPEDRTAPTTTNLEALKADYGIEYLLTGTYRGLSDGSSARLVAQLRRVDGEVVWSRDYDITRSAADFIAVQDRLSSDIVTQLGQIYGVVASDLRNRGVTRILPSDETFACLLQAHEYRRTLDDDMRAGAAECIEAAIKRDPDRAEAWAMAGFIRRDLALMEPNNAATRQALLDSALAATTRAVALDPRNVDALKAHAALLHNLGEYNAAETTIRKALALNPNDPETLHQLGWRLAVRGRLQEGVGYIRDALARSIDPPARYYNLVAIDDLMAGRYEDMLDASEITASSGSVVGLALAAIAHTRAASGSPEAAQAALDQLAQSQSPMSVSPGEYLRQHGTHDEIADAIVAGMIEAGWSRP